MYVAAQAEFRKNMSAVDNIFILNSITTRFKSKLLHSADVQHQISPKVQMHNSAIRCLVYSPCVCTGDDPLTEARELSSRTDAWTIY